jgi:hypothetical protein
MLGHQRASQGCWIRQTGFEDHDVLVRNHLAGVNWEGAPTDCEGPEGPSSGRQPGTSIAPRIAASTKPRLHGVDSMNPSFGSFGSSTGMAGIGAPAVASGLCVPAFRRVCLCRDPHGEGCDPADQL